MEHPITLLVCGECLEAIVIHIRSFKRAQTPFLTTPFKSVKQSLKLDSKIETIGSFLPFKNIITLYKKVGVRVKSPTYEIFPTVNLHSLPHVRLRMFKTNEKRLKKNSLLYTRA